MGQCPLDYLHTLAVHYRLQRPGVELVFPCDREHLS
jgi:hypothetical protein